MRLDKLLAHMGRGTRSEIKKLAKNKQIQVNGQTIKDSGMQVIPNQDVIEVSNERVFYQEFVYILMNKPQGVISATEDSRERTVLDLLSVQDRHFAPFPVGRLDKDTEGLLLLTNDGKLAHNLLSPRKHVPKTYFAVIAGQITERDTTEFANGVTLDDGYTTLPAGLEILPFDRIDQYRAKFAEHDLSADTTILSAIHVTIHEGKFHQVKRMFQAVGKKVLYLKRISMGTLLLDESLAPGQYRELAENERQALTSKA